MKNFENFSSLLIIHFYVYSTSDGQLVFGDLLLIISKNCKTAIFKSIPQERKGISYRKTITPFKETIDLMCNPPTFLGNTDEKLHMLRLLAGTLRLFILQKIAPSSDPIKIREAYL